MIRGLATPLRIVIALVMLLAVGGVFLNVLGQYRSAQRDTSPTRSSETTSDAEVGTTGVQPSADASKPGSTGSPGAAPIKAGTITVKIEGLNFRIEPKSDAEVHRGLRKGEVLIWLETRDGWYRARDAAGQEGWLSSNEQYATLAE